MDTKMQLIYFEEKSVEGTRYTNCWLNELKRSKFSINSKNLHCQKTDCLLAMQLNQSSVTQLLVNIVIMVSM